MAKRKKFAWWWIIVGDIVSLSQWMMQGKEPTVEPSKPLEVPIVEAGKTIPVLFGTRRITPILVWWGDVLIQKVKVSTQGKK